MNYYDTLFGDIVATGERARVANTYFAMNLEVGEKFTEVFGEDDDGKEGNGDSDDNNVQTPPNLFPSSSLKSGRSSGSKRKQSGVECVRRGTRVKGFLGFGQGLKALIFIGFSRVWRRT
ncbi:hypothetical protein POM88_031653 [Heracleum sosnowskyi]|uniref:Uncharacterized protein n=1 Tax=Heracleum sosnowskyi TaxID=360622 RepID=A0AAD8I0R1_9APIA|nr:hypothetical protein POM88_031653 [Heracleum sosnowskyi]